MFGFDWHWKTQSMQVEILYDLENLHSLLQGITINHSQYGLGFNFSPDGKYSIKTMRKKLELRLTSYNGLDITQSKAIPLKIKCFIWKVCLGRIPVQTNLTKRGILVQSTLCPLCNTSQETVDHMLVGCSIAVEVKDWILKWCGIHDMKVNNVNGFFNFVANWGNYLRKKGEGHCGVI